MKRIKQEIDNFIEIQFDQAPSATTRITTSLIFLAGMETVFRLVQEGQAQTEAELKLLRKDVQDYAQLLLTKR